MWSCCKSFLLLISFRKSLFSVTFFTGVDFSATMSLCKQISTAFTKVSGKFIQSEIYQIILDIQCLYYNKHTKQCMYYLLCKIQSVWRVAVYPKFLVPWYRHCLLRTWIYMISYCLYVWPSLHQCRPLLLVCLSDIRN